MDEVLDGWVDVHLRIKEASRSLNNANSLIESLYLINRTSLTSHNRNDVESQILGVEIGCEAEWQCLLLASRNLNVISRMSQVADNGGGRVSARRQWLESGQCASDDCDVDGLGLIVREIEQCLCRVPIYKLHTKDLGLWKRGRDGDSKIGCCWGRLKLFFNLEDRGVSLEVKLMMRASVGFGLQLLAQQRR